MRSKRIPAEDEEQYRLIMECRQSGLTDQKQLTWQQFDWLMSGLEIEQPEAFKPTE